MTDQSSSHMADDAPAQVTGLTPSQTVGPFFAIGLPWAAGPHAAVAGEPGAIRVTGLVTDGAGEPVQDALIETWQADPPVSDDFRGFTRTATGTDGCYELVTRQPGPIDDQAPHLVVSVFARGLLNRLVTRIYFADEPANETDPVLGLVTDPEARATLIAAAAPDGYRFDIRLQGAGETVFFAI